MEFGHLLDYNQYITVVFKSQVFLRGNLTKKKRCALAPGKNEKIQNRGTTSTVSISTGGKVVNS